MNVIRDFKIIEKLTKSKRIQNDVNNKLHILSYLSKRSFEHTVSKLSGSSEYPLRNSYPAVTRVLLA